MSLLITVWACNVLLACELIFPAKNKILPLLWSFSGYYATGALEVLLWWMGSLQNEPQASSVFTRAVIMMHSRVAYFNYQSVFMNAFSLSNDFVLQGTLFWNKNTTCRYYFVFWMNCFAEGWKQKLFTISLDQKYN